MSDIIDESGTDGTPVDLEGEIRDFEDRKPWQSGIYSKTLVKKKDLRVVLICMAPKARMEDHHADGTISIQVLKGAIRMAVAGRGIDLGVGHLLTLDPSVEHDVEAVDESAFLVTISWPSSKELQGMKHRGYGS